jgi:hypothetical protein
MCKHTEILTASRNAVVAVRAGLSSIDFSLTHKINNELSRHENAYDRLLEIKDENGCYECNNPEDEKYVPFLQFVAEYVEHYGNCVACSHA